MSLGGGHTSEEPFFVSQQVTEAARYYLNLNPSGERGLEVVCGGVERMRPEYVVRRTDFPFYALELVVEGEGTLELNGRRSVLEPGVMFAYGPGVAHAIGTHPRHRMRKYYLDFWGSEARELLDASGLGQWRALRVGAVHELTEIFHALGREARGEGALGHALCETLARFLLLKVQQNTVPGARSVPRSFTTYERLRRHIEKHYRRLRTVEDLATECAVTQVHVSRLFQRFARIGAYAFLLRLKMNDAAELLDDGLLVKEVAERLGFADAFQFSRAFKRVHGVSPGRLHQTRPRGSVAG
jgi:AraC-like DNA-binding protein